MRPDIIGSPEDEADNVLGQIEDLLKGVTVNQSNSNRCDCPGCQSKELQAEVERLRESYSKAASSYAGICRTLEESGRRREELEVLLEDSRKIARHYFRNTIALIGATLEDDQYVRDNQWLVDDDEGTMQRRLRRDESG